MRKKEGMLECAGTLEFTGEGRLLSESEGKAVEIECMPMICELRNQVNHMEKMLESICTTLGINPGDCYSDVIYL